MTYEPRFIAPADAAELVNLYHLARTAVGDGRYERRIRASNWFHQAHDEVTALGAYKDLAGLLEWEELQA